MRAPLVAAVSMLFACDPGETITALHAIESFDELDVNREISVSVEVSTDKTPSDQAEIVGSRDWVNASSVASGNGALRIEGPRRGGDADPHVDLVTTELAHLVANNGATVVVRGEGSRFELDANNGADVEATEYRLSDATVVANNGADVRICASGVVTGSADNGASISVACGGDVSAVTTANGGELVVLTDDD